MWLPQAEFTGTDNNSKSTATAAVYSLTYQCKQKTMPAPCDLS